MSDLTKMVKHMIPPCDKYRCGWYNECKMNKLACESFRLYVSNNWVTPPSRPSKQMYDKIYSEVDE